MSAWIIGSKHIDFLLTAGMESSSSHPLRWFTPEIDPIAEGSYQRGEPWGPEAVSIAKNLRRELTQETADAVGHMLIEENYQSVNHRYDEHRETEFFYAFKKYNNNKQIKPVQVLKAIACYEYQTCEHPEWEKSESRAFCAALRIRIIHNLPGYEEADWEIVE